MRELNPRPAQPGEHGVGIGRQLSGTPEQQAHLLEGKILPGVVVGIVMAEKLEGLLLVLQKFSQSIRALSGFKIILFRV